MKPGKFVSKITVLFLVFFLITAGAAQALNVSTCEGKCCQNIQEKSHPKSTAQSLSANPSIEFEPLTLLCDSMQQFSSLSSKTPEQENCHNQAAPSCCEMEQANDEVEGLISTAQSRVDRFLEIGFVCILPETPRTDDTLITASVRYSIPARATPTPLYLKNSVFLC